METNIIITLITTTIVVVLIAIKTIRTYNILVGKDTGIQVQQGQIDTTLQKRDDLVKQLSVLTKRASIFEQRTQTGSAKERNSGKRGDILATSESYPELHSVKTNFGFFQNQIAELESLLKEERNLFNELVGEYKVYVRTFPVILFAYPLGYKADKYKMFSTDIKNKPVFWEGKEE